MKKRQNKTEQHLHQVMSFVYWGALGIVALIAAFH